MEKNYYKINFDDNFIDLGFHQSYRGYGEWVMDLGRVGGISNYLVCTFLQNDYSINNWLTIEIVQKTGKKGKDINKFIKFNGRINNRIEMEFLITLILKTYKL